MKRGFLAAILTAAIAGPAYADVTLKQSVTGKGPGMSGPMSSTSYIKGLKMRADSLNGDTTRSMIFDVENQKIYIFDSKKKEADVVDMQGFGGEMSKAVDMNQAKAALKANGQTKQIAGKSATGYDMSVSMPATMGGEKGIKIDVSLTGPLWIVKGAPGSADFSRFYKGAVAKGFIFMDPRAAKGSPGQAKAMAEMYRQMADIGGVPYETEMNIKIGGDGPMAGIMAKMGGMSMTTTVQSIETGALTDDLFMPPAGYKLNPRK
jgi:hypothetical protein